MHGNRLLRLLPVLALFSLGSCGDREAEGHPPTPAAIGDAAVPGGAHTAESGVNDRTEVTVEGSPFAGTHRATGDLSCMMYGGVWQAVYELQGASGLSGLLVQLKEIPATGGSTDRLTLSVTFGQMDDMSGSAGLLDVVGSEYGGDGRGTVTREGGGAVLRVEGTAQHGGRVTAALHCATVDLMR